MMMIRSRSRSQSLRWTFGAVLATMLWQITTTAASNPFSSNVVALTAKNWRHEVEESPHAVFVNICQFERLAAAVKGTVKIAYWDTEQSGRRPTLLGDFKGTPTLRLYVPLPKQKNGHTSKKKVLDYPYERKAVDMKRFVDQNMPSFVESVAGLSGLEKFRAKAMKYGLPQVLLFTSKAQTMALTKYLSTEFRRRLLLAEVYPTKPNQSILEEYGIRGGKKGEDKNDNEDTAGVTPLPALIVVTVDGEILRYDAADGGGGSFTRRKLHSFLSQHALATKVSPSTPTAKQEETTATTPPPKTSKTSSQSKPQVVGHDGEL